MGESEKSRVDAKLPGGASPEKPSFPPAKSIFDVVHSRPDAQSSEGFLKMDRSRTGSLLGVVPTPAFTILTSRGFPLSLRPEVVETVMTGAPQLTQMPVGDLVLRQDLISKGPLSSEGCLGEWPHLKGQVTYASFRNPLLNASVHGGDAICSVETFSGRRKVGPKEFIQLQKTMRMKIVAAPAEEVPLDTCGSRRVNRAVTRAGDWLKEICEARMKDEDLSFDWHILAAVQGCNDVKVRQKACTASAEYPIAGYWIGSLGYSENLATRARVLEAVSSVASKSLPRFLPLNLGTPVEVLQAVLLGVDVLEIPYPTQAAAAGLALTFEWDMPEAVELSDESVDEALVPLMPAQGGGEDKSQPATDSVSSVPLAVKHLVLKELQFKEDFSPIEADSPVAQYSRAYVHHLLEVRELLATMLLTQHNMQKYKLFFDSIRKHIANGTLRRFAAWFMQTQTCDAKEALIVGPPGKKRKTV